MLNKIDNYINYITFSDVLQHDRCVYVVLNCRFEKLLFKIEKKLPLLQQMRVWQRRMCLHAYVQSSHIRAPDSEAAYYAGIIP